MRTIRCFLSMPVALPCLGLANAGAVTLDPSVAVTDPATLQALERGGLSISHLLGPTLGLTRDADNSSQFSVPALASVRDTVKREISDEPKTSEGNWAGPAVLSNAEPP
ncbi:MULTISPECIES: hypothetical protein [Mesorhizobium]|uniref:hypothetical protein n=1 Tax=Mesorhizobium TaxID=68287 RepID=UPI00031D2A6B|nr:MULTISPECIES: hypothetical protein [Mesorhizobium]